MSFLTVFRDTSNLWLKILDVLLVRISGLAMPLMPTWQKKSPAASSLRLVDPVGSVHC